MFKWVPPINSLSFIFQQKQLDNDYFIKKLCGVHLRIGVLKDPKKISNESTY